MECEQKPLKIDWSEKCSSVIQQDFFAFRFKEEKKASKYVWGKMQGREIKKKVVLLLVPILAGMTTSVETLTISNQNHTLSVEYQRRATCAADHVTVK